MSLHGRRYWGRLGGGCCPLAISAKQFPRRHLCERGHSRSVSLWLIFLLFPASWWPQQSSAHCSHLYKFFGLPSVNTSSSSARSLSSPHPSLSRKLLRLPLSLPESSQLSPEGTLSIPPWQSGGIYYSHLRPDFDLSLHNNKVSLMISCLQPRRFNEGQKVAASSKGRVLWVCLKFTDVCSAVNNSAVKSTWCAVRLLNEVSFEGCLRGTEISGAVSGSRSC